MANQLQTSQQEAELPQSFFCPLTLAIMKDPVVDPEGNSYERQAIEAWLMKDQTSPITRNKLSPNDLIPNRALREAIEERVPKSGTTTAITKPSAPVQTHKASAPVASKSSVPTLSIFATKENEKEDEATFLVQVQPPSSASPTPVDICCVVDVSGSMGTEATVQNQKGNVESHGLSLLDIVKHAVRTIITVLQPCDRLSLVAYSTKATKIFDLISMDAQGKKRAEVELDKLDSDGQTNLWDGLHTGLEVLRTSNKPGRLAAVLLLTDGQPNIEPPRGHIPMLQKYKDDHKQLSCSISTFGFGYNLDSTLLRDLAVEGNGMYSFIPDSGFVGTAFVNSTSNLLATMGRNVSLSLEAHFGATIPEGSIEGYSVVYNSWGALVNLSSLQFDQPKGIIVKVKIPKNSSTKQAYISASLKYETKDGSDKLEVKTESIEWDKNTDEIKLQHFRLSATETILEAIKLMKDSKGDAAKKLIQNLVQQIKNSSIAKNPQAQGLLKDLEGQVTEAFNKQEYFTKWGNHYLPSLVNAHLLQICNNFKDPGVQFYGGKLFKELRDKADEAFIKLPPPKPKPSPYATHQARAPTIQSMGRYHSSGNPCFHGDCLVQMADGSFKKVKQVSKGDRILSLNGNPAEVVCVVRTNCKNNKTELVELPGGLLITPYHPVQSNGKWVFPLDLAAVNERECEAVYSFVLGEEHIMMINGVACVTLGHNFQGDVVEHAYFGTSAIVEDLKNMSGWSRGLIVFSSGCLLRDNQTSLVCGLSSLHLQPAAITLLV